VQAQVYRDLAVVYVTGLKRLDEGQKLLVLALELDPEIALDADLTTPELVRVFAQARKQARGEAEPKPVAAPSRTKPGKRAKAPKPMPVEEEEEPSGGSLDDEAIDCPPDFPGCESLEERAEREAREAEAQAESEEDAGILKNFLSASVQQDFLMFGGETGVCTAEGPAELSCYRAGDTFRDPAELYAGNGGAVGGGFQLATTRLLIGYERLLWPGVSVGVLAGYAIGGAPAEPGGAAFVPIHAELRGKYTFSAGNLPLRPFATLGGGLAQVDSSVTTDIVDRSNQGEVFVSRVTVWQKTGTSFATLGAGALYPIGETGGVTAELKGLLLFPSSGTSAALQIGYSHGF
jgi:hypothetical protein